MASPLSDSQMAVTMTRKWGVRKLLRNSSGRRRDVAQRRMKDCYLASMKSVSTSEESEQERWEAFESNLAQRMDTSNALTKDNAGQEKKLEKISQKKLNSRQASGRSEVIIAALGASSPVTTEGNEDVDTDNKNLSSRAVMVTHISSVPIEESGPTRIVPRNPVGPVVSNPIKSHNMQSSGPRSAYSDASSTSTASIPASTYLNSDEDESVGVITKDTWSYTLANDDDVSIVGTIERVVMRISRVFLCEFAEDDDDEDNEDGYLGAPLKV